MATHPALPLNQILQGDCVEQLNRLPANSVDLIFADPPYNLQLQKTLFRPNQSVVDAVDDAWDQFEDFAAYDAFTRDWLTACRRVLKDTGTLWVIGSYHNIYRVGANLMDLGYWVINDVVWMKCLAGNTMLYALLNGKPILSTLKDLARLSLATNHIQLPSFDEAGCFTWVTVQGWQKQEDKARGRLITLEDGSQVECSDDHQFPVLVQGEIVYKAAGDLHVDDILLSLNQFELPSAIQSEGMDEAIGRLIGWYLAEGSYVSEEKGIQFSLSGDEVEVAQNLIQLIQSRFGIVGRIHQYRNSIMLIFAGRWMIEFIKRFVAGENSKTKYLTQAAYSYGPEFIRGIMSGYLAGDGSWEASKGRWRLGFTRNEALMNDLRTMCRILGWRLKLYEARTPYQRGIADTFRGELRLELDRYTSINVQDLGLPVRRHFTGHQKHALSLFKKYYKWSTRNNPMQGEMPLAARMIIYGQLRPMPVKAIQEGTLRYFYDVAVNGNHVFALSSGLLTHNSNPMPNFRGTRFTNATETLIWAQKNQKAHYTFNYHALKHMNDDKQMTNVWSIPLCTGAERLKVDGKKAHSTQKPEALLYRVIASSSNPGDVVLDPFFGTGTTGAVAKKLGRNFIGIERESDYIALAQARIDSISASQVNPDLLLTPSKRSRPRVRFAALVESGLISIGQVLTDPTNTHQALVRADSTLQLGAYVGSIHKTAAYLRSTDTANGWDFWHLIVGDNPRVPLDNIREQYRQEHGLEDVFEA